MWKIEKLISGLWSFAFFSHILEMNFKYNENIYYYNKYIITSGPMSVKLISLICCQSEKKNKQTKIFFFRSK